MVGRVLSPIREGKERWEDEKPDIIIWRRIWFCWNDPYGCPVEIPLYGILWAGVNPAPTVKAGIDFDGVEIKLLFRARLSLKSSLSWYGKAAGHNFALMAI